MTLRALLGLGLVVALAGCAWERESLPVPVYGDVEGGEPTDDRPRAAPFEPLPSRLDVVASNVASVRAARRVAERFAELRDVLIDRHGGCDDGRDCLRIRGPAAASSARSASEGSTARELVVTRSPDGGETRELELRVFDAASGALLWRGTVSAEQPEELADRAVSAVVSVEPLDRPEPRRTKRRVVGVDRRPVRVRY